MRRCLIGRAIAPEPASLMSGSLVRYIFTRWILSQCAQLKFWNHKAFSTTRQRYINQRIENVTAGINGGPQDLVQDVTAWQESCQPHFMPQYRHSCLSKGCCNEVCWPPGTLRGTYMFSQHTMDRLTQPPSFNFGCRKLGQKTEVSFRC